MLEDRPSIPASLKRDVLVEAGHRCAIPACRAHPVEIAHIVPWAKVRRHEMINLIALCPTCHTRYDRGEIDRKAMQKYKQNLSLMQGLYSSLERRVLEHFARLRDIKIHLAPLLHMRQQLGEKKFLEFVNETSHGDSEKALEAPEWATEMVDDRITLTSGNRLLLLQLIRDGYLVCEESSIRYIEDIAVLEDFVLTRPGKEFVDAWITADNLNPYKTGCGEEGCVGESFAHYLNEHVDPGGYDAVARSLRVEF